MLLIGNGLLTDAEADWRLAALGRFEHGDGVTDSAFLGVLPKGFWKFVDINRDAVEVHARIIAADSFCFSCSFVTQLILS